MTSQAIGTPVCVRIQRGTAGSVQDATITRLWPFINWGSATTLHTGRLPIWEQQALVRFDLSSIPSSAVVTSAKLVMHKSSGNKPVDVHRVTAAWAEGSVTWSNFNGAYASAVEATLPTTGGATEANVTSLVSGWLSGAHPNYGLLLDRDPLGATEFKSSEGSPVSHRPALDVCYVTAPSYTCGDGTLGGAEACDDGNTVSGDGCSATCTIESGYTCSGSPSACATVCGDGIKAGAEACDDGNASSGDGCSAACAPENGYACSGSPSICATVCGDGIKAGAEACDDGNASGGDGCSASCAVESGYACSGSPSACAAICGDGIKLAAEACDDGNAANGDGCSASCAVESGYACSGSPSACAAICGDGIKLAAEACDDGNATNGDGCSASCTVESGYACSGSPSACAAVCGDGIKLAAEACDDGNAANGDGCSASCTVESGYTCTGSPSVCFGTIGTPCNDGNLCTTGDVWASGGVCAGTPVPCTPSACQSAGACDAGSGQCVFTTAADGTACTGGACQGGQCMQTQLDVKVFDRNGDAITGAKVVVGATAKLTGADGKATFTGVAAGDTIAQVTATGYTPAAPHTTLIAGNTQEVVTHLIDLGERVAFYVASGAEAIVDDDKVRVSIPSNAVVDANNNPVTGVIEMSVVPLDPTTDDLDVMPGRLMGVPTLGAPAVNLSSVFMADISLWRGNTAVKLKAGSTATLEFDLPDDLQAVYNNGDTIDAWYFDLTDGIWRREGSGTVVASSTIPGRLAWRATVSHFSWWNADYSLPGDDCVEIYVKDFGDTAVPGARVSLTSLGANTNRYAFNATNTTNSSGYACVEVPRDVIRVTATAAGLPNIIGMDYPQVDTTTPGPSASCGGSACKQLVVKLGADTCLSGIVQDDAFPTPNPIENARVLARYNTGRGPESSSTLTDLGGRYCVNAPMGADVLVQANHTQGPSVVKTAERLVHTGVSSLACDDTVDGAGCTSVLPLTPTCTTSCASWATSYGDGQDQYMSGLTVDLDGNTFITGYFTGSMTFDTTPPTTLTNTGTNPSDYDIYVAKLDQVGKAIWAKKFAGTGNTTQESYSIAADQAGDVILVGSYKESIVFSSTSSLTSSAADGYDGFVVRMSGTNGAISQARKFGGAGFQFPRKVLVDQTNSVTVVGEFTNQIDCSGGMGSSFCASHGGQDIFIDKILSASFWGITETYGGTGDEYVNGAATDSTGQSLVLTGSFLGSLTFGGTTLTTTAGSSGDAFVSRFSMPTVAFGAITPQWSKAFRQNTACTSGCGTRSGANVTFDTASPPGVWFTGDFSHSIIIAPTGIANDVAGALGVTDAFVAHLNGATGDTIWSDTIANSNWQRGTSIAVDTDGALLLAGSVTQDVWFGTIHPPYVPGAEQLFVAKVSTSHTYLWANRYGDSGVIVRDPAIGVRPFGATPLVSGDILVAGRMANGDITFDADTGTTVNWSGGGNDAFVVKILASQ
ncbi:Multiple EGF-like-domain protein 3 precursor [Minicystis rosea]|nr:Multiple EGF-like-domain protein 3 precursor [Minicystis rosea]